MPNFVVMVGLPCSGKSTYIKENFPDYVVISSDDFVEYIAKVTNSTYNDVFEYAMKDVNKHLDMVRDIAISLGKNIVHDQTNMSSKKRKQILSKIPENYSKMCIVIEAPMKVILDRNDNRPGKYIPHDVFGSMINRYEEPTLDEGWVYIQKKGNL